ncbi:MAG: four helix bundle protein [Betaproteobacteria bacterium]|nr:MAG: four helix bundle protein [Betaproteobacteria bacterium]
MTTEEKQQRSHRDFPVWKAAMLLAETVYDISAKFPADERFGLIAQIRRSAVSIPSNIAEGAGRSSTGELGHFLGIALGSVAELETQLELADRLNLTDDTEEAFEQLEDVRKQLILFRRSLKS